MCFDIRFSFIDSNVIMNPNGVFGKKSKQFYFSTLSTQPSCGRIVIEEHSDGFDSGYKHQSSS